MFIQYPKCQYICPWVHLFLLIFIIPMCDANQVSKDHGESPSFEVWNSFIFGGVVFNGTIFATRQPKLAEWLVFTTQSSLNHVCLSVCLPVYLFPQMKFNLYTNYLYLLLGGYFLPLTSKSVRTNETLTRKKIKLLFPIAFSERHYVSVPPRRSLVEHFFPLVSQ